MFWVSFKFIASKIRKISAKFLKNAKKYFSVAYNVEIPSMIQKRFEAVPETWKHYNDRLYYLKEKLSDLKDSFIRRAKEENQSDA